MAANRPGLPALSEGSPKYPVPTGPAYQVWRRVEARSCSPSPERRESSRPRRDHRADPAVVIADIGVDRGPQCQAAQLAVVRDPVADQSDLGPAPVRLLGEERTAAVAGAIRRLLGDRNGVAAGPVHTQFRSPAAKAEAKLAVRRLAQELPVANRIAEQVDRSTPAECPEGKSAGSGRVDQIHDGGDLRIVQTQSIEPVLQSRPGAQQPTRAAVLTR